MDYQVKYVSVKTAASILGLSQKALRAGAKAGTIPHIMCGRTIKIDLPRTIEQLENVGNLPSR